MATIQASLPGTILKILVQPGDRLEAYGDPALILEAMKMENEISAEDDGVVKEILVKEGDVVAAGQTLLVLE